MIAIPFGRDYAEQYDLLYANKNYAGECDLLEEVFRRFGDGQVRVVLDMGCGTGEHAIVLAKRGYRVTGIERSREMLGRAHSKATAANINVRWIEGDIQRTNGEGPYDAVTLMFAVLGYQVTNAEVLAVLTNAHRHLRPGGLLVFDTWYGPAVLGVKPADRIKVIEDNGGQVIRTATSTLDTRHHLCDVHYRLWRVVGDQVVSRSQELHRMRFFLPMELEFFLNSAGFTLVSLSAFPELDRPADETTWNVLWVAKRG